MFPAKTEEKKIRNNTNKSTDYNNMNLEAEQELIILSNIENKNTRKKGKKKKPKEVYQERLIQQHKSIHYE